MATIDTSIYQGLLQAPKSVADYDAEAVKTQQNRLALQLQQGQLAAQQAGVARTNKLASVLGGFAPGLSTTEQGDALTRSGFIDEGRKVIESAAKANKDEREGEKAKREAEKFQFENARDQLGFVNQIIGSAKDQASYTQGRQAMAARGLDVSQIPEQFDPAYVQSAGAQTLTQLQRLDQVWKQKGFDLDTQKFGETVRSNKAGEGLTARGQNMAADTANKRLAFDKAKEEGNAPGDLSEATVDAIGQGRMKAPTGYALRNPKMANLMDRVNAKYQDFDATEYDAKQKAMRDFSTGTQGNSIRSFAVATDHLGQLNKLIDALDNGNIPLVNKYSNIVAAATGSVAPTNLDAAKLIVGKEVLKAIVAGGGGVEERQELSRTLDNAKSTKQLKGVSESYLHLMEAQKEKLERQYELSTGRKDAKTRFKYTSESAPSDVATTAYADAEKERRYQEYKAKQGQK